LRVPSRDTASWLEKLATKGWLAEGIGVLNLDEFRAIPLKENAPFDIEGMEQIEAERKPPRPKHWLDHIEDELREKYREYWPMSHDELGDIIILKIPKEVSKFENIIAEAILEHHQSTRLVCADEGVKGQFRVRDLRPIGSRDGNTSTKTRVKENGYQLWIDPAKAYYSPRLATERLKTLEQIKRLQERLGRPLNLIDPYAGVGPALPILLNEGLIDWAHASDLNPEAVKLLKENLPSVNTGVFDALDLPTSLNGLADVLLVNLPHSSIEHLQYLTPLLSRGEEVLVRGWAIVGNNAIESSRKLISEIFSFSEIIALDFVKTRSYSPSDAYCSFQVSCIIADVKD